MNFYLFFTVLEFTDEGEEGQYAGVSQGTQEISLCPPPRMLTLERKYRHSWVPPVDDIYGEMTRESPPGEGPDQREREREKYEHLFIKGADYLNIF